MRDMDAHRNVFDAYDLKIIFFYCNDIFIHPMNSINGSSFC